MYTIEASQFARRKTITSHIRHTFSLPWLPTIATNVHTHTHTIENIVIEIECICAKEREAKYAVKKYFLVCLFSPNKMKIRKETEKNSHSLSLSLSFPYIIVLLKRKWNIQITICVSASCIFHLLQRRHYKSNIRGSVETINGKTHWHKQHNGSSQSVIISVVPVSVSPSRYRMSVSRLYGVQHNPKKTKEENEKNGAFVWHTFFLAYKTVKFHFECQHFAHFLWSAHH